VRATALWIVAGCSAPERARDAAALVDVGAPGDVKAPPPDAVLPDAVLPDAVLPDAAPPLPDAVLPDAVLPDAVLPDAVLPDAVLPDAPPQQPPDAAPPLPDAAAGERCEGGEDDDADGLTDCDDPDCFLAPRCLPAPEVCDDGRDNDLDGRADCCDPTCAGAPACPRGDAPPYTQAELQAHLTVWCGGCHMGEQRQSGLSLDPPFTDKTVGVQSAQVPGVALIEPGDRLRSFFWLKVAGRQREVGGGFGDMPPRERLCADEIERLGGFIDALVDSPHAADSPGSP